MIKFKSKVVRVQEMGGKVVVEFKERVFNSDSGDAPAVDTQDVQMFDTPAAAEIAIKKFVG